MNFFIPLLLLLATSVSSAQSQDEVLRRTRMIEAIVENYQGEAVARFGHRIELTFSPTNSMLQALGGWDNNGKLLIAVYGGILALPAAAIPAVICHELGHIFGEVPFSRLPPNRRPGMDLKNNVEGEADYFGGRCLVRFFAGHAQAHQLALASAKATLETISSRNISWPLPPLLPFNGINSGYPAPECRLLSMFSGIYGRQRPKCWFNP